MKTTIRNENGVALVTALMLTLIALGVIMVLLYYLTQSIQVSAAKKRYQNALEASYGGVEVFTKELLPVLVPYAKDADVSLPTTGFPLVPVFQDQNGQNCFKEKLRLPTLLWSTSLCTAANRSSVPSEKPDAKFTLQGAQGQPGFTIYTKIVDTVEGNTDLSGESEIAGLAGVAYGTATGPTPKPMPMIYRIEVQSERETNPKEKARLSVLYAF